MSELPTAEPRCYVCQTLLPDINAACPKCLPNFYGNQRAASPRPPASNVRMVLPAGETVHIRGVPVQLATDVEVRTSDGNRELICNQLLPENLRDPLKVMERGRQLLSEHKPSPCWCPYCGEPHSAAQRDTVETTAPHPHVSLNGHQIRAIVQFLGNGWDTDVSIGYLEAVPPTEELKLGRPAGYYVWCTEYPEEGSWYLNEERAPFTCEHGVPDKTTRMCMVCLHNILRDDAGSSVKTPAPHSGESNASD